MILLSNTMRLSPPGTKKIKIIQKYSIDLGKNKLMDHMMTKHGQIDIRTIGQTDKWTNRQMDK